MLKETIFSYSTYLVFFKTFLDKYQRIFKILIIKNKIIYQLIFSHAERNYFQLQYIFSVLKNLALSRTFAVSFYSSVNR